MIRYYVVLDGRVQGVGFRYFAQSNAIKLNLTGWVRNMDNGMVELEVQGVEEKVNKFLSIIRRGNSFINVNDFSVKKIDIISTEEKFKVSY